MHKIKEITVKKKAFQGVEIECWHLCNVQFHQQTRSQQSPKKSVLLCDVSMFYNLNANAINNYDMLEGTMLRQI